MATIQAVRRFICRVGLLGRSSNGSRPRTLRHRGREDLGHTRAVLASTAGRGAVGQVIRCRASR
jgi:hypothetical protein